MPREAPYLALAGVLRARILAGEWEIGERLPSRAGFAAEYGVGRNVVRRAMDRLIIDGLLEGRAGSGTYSAYRESDCAWCARGTANAGRALPPGTTGGSGAGPMPGMRTLRYASPRPSRSPSGSPSAPVTSASVPGTSCGPNKGSWRARCW